MGLAQLVHESLDQLGTAVAEQLGTHPQLAVPSRWARPQLPIATMTGWVWMPASVSEYAARCPRVASSG